MCKTKTLLIFLVILALSSCKTHYVVEYRDRVVTEYQTKEVHDTLIQNVHDSIYHTIFQNGDTVYDTKYVERIKYRDKIVYKADTCWRDSVVYKDVERRVEVKKTPKWCYFSLIFSALCIAAIAILIKLR